MKYKLLGVFIFFCMLCSIYSVPSLAATCTDANCGTMTCASGFERDRGGCKICRCTPDPKVVKTWTFNATINCPAEYVLSQKVRFFSASFLEGQNIPGDFYWDYQPYSYDLTRSLTVTNYTPNDAMYVGLESDVMVSKSIGGGQYEQDPVELIPTGTSPNTILEYGKWFNPQTSMTKFVRDTLPEGTYAVNFSIPDSYKAQWCVTPTPGPCPKRGEGDANCDGQINEVDYGIFKSTINGTPVCMNCSADFNKDTKVDAIDYEIWRSTVYN